MIKKEFGPDYFKEITGCRTYEMRSNVHGSLHRLLDHGFVVDSVPVWENELLTQCIYGHEFAIISRTYCSNDQIDNPPDGLRCIRLRQTKVMDVRNMGTAIATVIIKKTQASEDYLLACANIPIHSFIYLLPRPMHKDGYGILLQLAGLNQSSMKIIKAA